MSSPSSSQWSSVIPRSKAREMDEGMFCEKAFEIIIRQQRQNGVRCALEMYHLSLNKQSRYLGQRGLKYFEGLVDVCGGTSKRIRARITPFALQKSELELKQNVVKNDRFVCNGVIAMRTQSESEVDHSNVNEVTLKCALKHRLFRTSFSLFADESMKKYGVNYTLAISNDFNAIRGKKTKEVNDTAAPSPANAMDWLAQPIFEVSASLRSLRFEKLHCEVFADLVCQKFEAIVSAHIDDSSRLRSLFCIFKYNSSLWMRFSKNSNGGGGGAQQSADSTQNDIEVVYKHRFNEFITLKNYVNSSYTVATNLTYSPNSVLTLIYSASVNIMKFKENQEDYKTGYAIHLNF